MPDVAGVNAPLINLETLSIPVFATIVLVIDAALAELPYLIPTSELVVVLPSCLAHTSAV